MWPERSSLPQFPPLPLGFTWPLLSFMFLPGLYALEFVTSGLIPLLHFKDEEQTL